MYWFDEQLRNRMANDEDTFMGALAELSSLAMDDSKVLHNTSKRQRTKNAIDDIAAYFKVELIPIPDAIDEIHSALDYALRPAGIMKRKVELKEGWYKDAIGPMIGSLQNNDVVALIPTGGQGYSFFDYDSNRYVRIDQSSAKLIQTDAYCFYKPLPFKALSIPDLLQYMAGFVTRGDVFFFLLVTSVVTLLGLMSPMINRILYGYVIPSGNLSYILPGVGLLASFSVSAILLSISKFFITERLNTRISMAIEPAAMSRLLLLPAAFFKDYNAGELSSRISVLSGLCTTIVGMIVGTFLPAVFSISYLFQIRYVSGALLAPAVLQISGLAVLNIIVGMVGLNISRKRMKLSASLSGLVFALFSGVAKIKLTGAEKRAFAKWSEKYTKSAALLYKPPAIIKYSPIVGSVITSLCLLFMYYTAVVSGVQVADYMAFNIALGAVSAAIMSLCSATITIAQIKPMLEMVEPILKNIPETNANKIRLSRLSGSIEVSNLSFRYSENGEDILSNISFKIRPNQFVAIVGKTGCGKSTLLRLLLGFEKPRRGAIYYDGVDITRLDVRSLRSKIGTVTQNSKLFPGDIYSNIVISAPHLTLDDAWEAARLVSLDDDINEMPMGMHTVISEGSGGISGGQKQRLIIARAIAPKPSVLMFDEATSALDNITQKNVSLSLEAMKCTRICIAHRLSTIKNCDRIIVLDKGKIIEDGSYQQLMAQNGFFCELLSRQLLDEDIQLGVTTAF